ncbi:MAG: hypothetical protein IKB07_08265 [Lachnospiraceae bacterium]|nr:hypothetical protein [Lachnospiraceae bacterium]
MTREETKKLIQVMCAAYPNYRPTNLTDTVDVWHLMLEEYDYKNIALALKAFISTDTGGFAPSVGQVLGCYHSLTAPEELNEMQAWGYVAKAIRNGIYAAEEEFAKLPPEVREAVGNSGNIREWATMDTGSIHSVVQSNFMRTYRAVLAKKNQMIRLPRDVKAMIAEKESKRLTGEGGRECLQIMQA